MGDTCGGGHLARGRVSYYFLSLLGETEAGGISYSSSDTCDYDVPSAAPTRLPSLEPSHNGSSLLSSGSGGAQMLALGLLARALIASSSAAAAAVDAATAASASAWVSDSPAFPLASGAASAWFARRNDERDAVVGRGGAARPGGWGVDHWGDDDDDKADAEDRRGARFRAPRLRRAWPMTLLYEHSPPDAMATGAEQEESLHFDSYS